MRRFGSTLLLHILLLCLIRPIEAQQAQKDIDSLLQRIRSGKYNNAEWTDKAALSLLYFKTGQYEPAETLYQESLKGARQAKDTLSLGLLFHNRGIMFFYQYVLDSAERYFKEAAALRKISGDDSGLLKTYSNLASIHFMKSDFKKSLELFNEGLRLENKLGYPEGKYIDQINMAMAYRYLKQFDQAIVLYRKCLAQHQGNAKKVYQSCSGLYSTFKEIHNMDSAVKYLYLARDKAAENGDPVDIAYSESDLGLYLSSVGKKAEAIASFRKTLSIGRSMHDRRLELASAGNLAANFIELGLIDSSDRYMSQVIELRKNMPIGMDSEDLLRLLADYYYRKKDYANSYTYFKKYSDYRDSIFRIESSNKLVELQEKYQSEVREKENRLLSLENDSITSTRNYLLLILAISIIGLALIAFAYRRLQHSRRMLKEQKELLAEQQKEILDSIHYARRIQFALLTSHSLLQKHLSQYFILFKPKAVVSGDFYWAIPSSKGIVYVTGDCTGHGVPGAFMSLLFITKLNQAISEYNIERPDLLLNRVRDEIIRSLNPEGSTDETKDGMDAVVCHLDQKNLVLEYAAANNSFYIVRRGELLVCKADKMPVGKGYSDIQPFSYKEIKLETGDIIYTLTDGFADQFGGKAGKKFKYKQLEELLLQIWPLPMAEQRDKLEQAFNDWKGELEQVDDLCLIGVKME